MHHLKMTSLPPSSNVDRLNLLNIKIANDENSTKNSICTNQLPRNYEPNEYDVLCGRGKGYYNASGNRKFRKILLENLPCYTFLSVRVDKSVFFSEIVETVRERSNGQAKFIRRSKEGYWELLSEYETREKVGHAIREAIEPRYKMKAFDCLKSPIIGSKRMSTKKQHAQHFGPIIVTNFNQMQESDSSQDVSDDDDLFKPLPLTAPLPPYMTGLNDTLTTNIVTLLLTDCTNIYP